MSDVKLPRFQDQVAVITGGARGIGKEIARRLAKEGAVVYLLDLNSSELDRTIREFEESRYLVDGSAVDISSEEDVIQVSYLIFREAEQPTNSVF